MKKSLAVFLGVVIMYYSCSKDNSVRTTAKNTYKVSVAPVVSSTVNSSWQQVLGGKAALTFAPVNADSLTLSGVNDSLNLNTISIYNKHVIAVTLNLTLQTQSKAVADTFIRFSAQAKNIVINKDQTLSLAATTFDGVVTIKRDFVDSLTVPTYVVDGSTDVQNFGLANGYYYIYVKGSASGKVTFTETTTGLDYIKVLTVSALNQYDLSPIIGPHGAVKVQSFAFRKPNNQIQ